MSEITRDEALAHFGVKGMKWGVRRAGTTGGHQGLSKKQKTAVKIGAGVLAVAGAAAAVVILKKNGNAKLLDEHNFQKMNKLTQDMGARAVRNAQQDAWRKSISELSKDIASANASQADWARKATAGLPAKTYSARKALPSPQGFNSTHFRL